MSVGLSVCLSVCRSITRVSRLFWPRWDPIRKQMIDKRVYRVDCKRLEKSISAPVLHLQVIFVSLPVSKGCDGLISGLPIQTRPWLSATYSTLCWQVFKASLAPLMWHSPKEPIGHHKLSFLFTFRLDKGFRDGGLYPRPDLSEFKNQFWLDSLVFFSSNLVTSYPSSQMRFAYCSREICIVSLSIVTSSSIVA